MADQIEINIYMKDGGGEQTAVNDNTGSGGNLPGVSQEASTKSGSSESGSTNLSKLGKFVASKTIDVFIGNTKSVISQNIGLVTGKSELQQRVNFGMSMVQRGVNVYSSAMAGGMIAGPVGAVVGAAASIIGEGINYAFRQNQLNIQENLENRQIQQIITRAGAGFNRSREGN